MEEYRLENLPKNIGGKTRGRQVFRTLWNNRVVIENPDSFQPTDVTYVIYDSEKTGMHGVQRELQQGRAQQSRISRMKLLWLPVGLSISSGTLPP